MAEHITEHNVEQGIFVVRSRRVMVDRDLAHLYGVKTKYLNQQVRRNADRFPEAFMFQLTASEKTELVAICNRFESMKHSRNNPLAFTEHGIIMLSAVLNSGKAITISVMVVNAFIRLREFIATHKDLAAKLQELEHKVNSHDKNIILIFQASINSWHHQRNRRNGLDSILKENVEMDL